MKLIDRYVEAVQRELPAPVRGDVGTELSDLLQDKVEALAQANHRAPSDEEVAQVLRQHGHPYAVALAYHSRRALVSERAYPLYRMVLGRTLATYLLGAVAVSLLQSHPSEGSWGLLLLPNFLGNVWTALLCGLIIVTTIFHFFGDQLAASPFFWRWDPMRLPAIPGTWAAISGVAASAAVITAVINLYLLSLPQSFTLAGAPISIDPAVTFWLFPMRLLVFGLLVLQAVNLFQRYWTRTKLIAAAVLDLALAACLTGIAVAPSILDFVVTAPPSGAWVPFIPNLNIRIVAGVVAATLLYKGVLCLYRSTLKPVPML